MTEFVHLKESYIQKWKFAEKFTQAIQDVNECFLIGTYLENMHYTHYLTYGSSMRLQTADKKHCNNPQVIHSAPVHWLMSCKVKKLYLCNKHFSNINWWTNVVWIIVVFISCLEFDSHGTHSLQSIYGCASDGILNLLHFFSEEQKTHPHL